VRKTDLATTVTIRDLRAAINVLDLMPDVFAIITKEKDVGPDPIVMWVFKTASEKLSAMLEILDKERL
jgi:hypothetical protein